MTCRGRIEQHPCRHPRATRTTVRTSVRETSRGAIRLQNSTRRRTASGKSSARAARNAFVMLPADAPTRMEKSSSTAAGRSSVSARSAPTWYAPRAPPPDKTNALCMQTSPTASTGRAVRTDLRRRVGTRAAPVGEMKSTLGAGPLLCTFAAAACSPATDLYVPQDNARAVLDTRPAALYELPKESPRDEVRIAALGITTLALSGPVSDEIRALRAAAHRRGLFDDPRRRLGGCRARSRKLLGRRREVASHPVTKPGSRGRVASPPASTVEASTVKTSAVNAGMTPVPEMRMSPGVNPPPATPPTTSVPVLRQDDSPSCVVRVVPVRP